MKAFILLALIASATAVPFLDRFSLTREDLMKIKAAIVETTTQGFEPGMETTTEGFSPYEKEDMNAPEFMVWKLDDEIEDIDTPEILEVGSRKFQILQRIANRQAGEEALDTTTEGVIEDMNAPEFIEVDSRKFQILQKIANRQAGEEALETTTVDFSPWEVKEDMNEPEHMAVPEIQSRREEIFGRLEEMLNERKRQ